jgi:SAM-dependent methyltransferase
MKPFRNWLPTREALLQSDDEWAVRTRVLAESLSRLVSRYVDPITAHGLDVGCQRGRLTDYLNAHTPISWEGIDPAWPDVRQSPDGATLYPAAADTIPYPDRYFDCLLFANVFEHVTAEQRDASLAEMYRVLRPGGVLVGQLPNPYFPIESHSRLPFMGWLPYKLQKKYWRYSPVPWEHNFYSVTIRHLRHTAELAGFQVTATKNFNYPPEALPSGVRFAADLFRVPMRLFPWAWQFVFTRPEDAESRAPIPHR